MNNLITYIDCSNNELTTMNNLPKFLTMLNCSYNYIISFGKLSLNDKLKRLNCSFNKINYLDNLPDGLEYLDCSYNPIINLENLPNSLIELVCNYTRNPNNINFLPETLKILNYLEDSKYDFMVGDLPCSIEIIYISHKCSLKNINTDEWSIIKNLSETKLVKNKFLSNHKKPIEFNPTENNIYEESNDIDNYDSFEDENSYC
jgi:hypothetical protein